MTYIGDIESFENVISIENMASMAEKDEHITKLNKAVGLTSSPKQTNLTKLLNYKSTLCGENINTHPRNFGQQGFIGQTPSSVPESYQSV